MSVKLTFKFWVVFSFIVFLSACSKVDMPDTKNATYLINIDVEQEIPRDRKLDMILSVNFAGEQTMHGGNIERRGGFSISFPKQSFEIDFNEDISLAGLPPDDDWILNANYIDKTFLRHVVSYELFEKMGEHNIASKTQFVELSLDQNFNGLYVLMEKLDKSSLQIDGNDPTAFIFKEPHVFRESYAGILPQDEANFHQQTFPDIEKEDKRVDIEDLREFILNSSDVDFFNGIGDLLDMESIIDWHILLLVTNNNDGVLKNFYLYKQDSSSKIKIAPWDYDHSFGRDGDNELNLIDREVQLDRSILFKRLLTERWYMAQLKSKWNLLNQQGIVNIDGLKQQINIRKQEVSIFISKNAQRWPVDDPLYKDANAFEEEIDIMLRFIDMRHQSLAQYFGEF